MSPDPEKDTDYRDHHGDEISRRMKFLDRTINDVLGKQQKLGGIESLIEDCERFVDDLSDGITDSSHSTLHLWRPPAQRMPEGANRYEESGAGIDKPPTNIEPPTKTQQPDEYYIRRNWKGEKQVMGPVSKRKLTKNIQSGNIVRSDEVRSGQDGPWQRAGKMALFKSLFPKQ